MIKPFPHIDLNTLTFDELMSVVNTELNEQLRKHGIDPNAVEDVVDDLTGYMTAFGPDRSANEALIATPRTHEQANIDASNALFGPSTDEDEFDGCGFVMKEWNLACPNCRRDNRLDISIAAWARLSADGTDVTAARDSSHEWDGNSRMVCTACNFTDIVYEFAVPGVSTL
jgi:hypothetical protein